MSKQPRDDANAPIPVLGLRPSGGQSVSISGTTARSAEINSHIRVVTLFSDTDCFIETGNSTVTASASTSHFLPASHESLIYKYFFPLKFYNDYLPLQF